MVKLLWEIMGWQALGTTKRILLSLQMVGGDGTGTGKLTPVGLIVVWELMQKVGNTAR